MKATEAEKERMHAYYAAHRDEMLARQKEWYEGHRKEVAEYRSEHREQIAASSAAYHAAHKEEINARKAAWHAAHREARAAYAAANRDRRAPYYVAWRAAEPEKVKAAMVRYRARKLGAEGAITDGDIKEQYARQDGKCFWCGKKVGKKYHVDHVVPLSRGGSNWPENIVIACAKCNQRKGNKLPHEWSDGRRLP